MMRLRWSMFWIFWSETSCQHSFEFWDDTCKISTNMSATPFSFRTRPATAALPGRRKADSCQGCCGSSPRGLVLLGENCGVIRVHPTGRLFFQGSNWFNLWPFRIKTDHRQTKWDMLALWIFSGWSNGNPVGPFYVNGNFEEPIAKLRRNLKPKVAKMSYLKWFAMEHGTLVCIPKVLHAWPKHENH